MTGALDPAGTQAATIAELSWILTGVAAVVWTLVVVTLGGALFHRRPAAAGTLHAREAATHSLIGIAMAATVGVLFGLVALAYAQGRALSSLDIENAVVVQVVGHQFWWEIRYNDPDPSREVATANELHVPVGLPVVLNLSSNDVIHSFWVPSLHGKMDLIPGHETHLAIRADRPGRFMGRCAEFCGFQHAQMAIEVVAEPPEAFFAWLEAQRAAAPAPPDAQAAAGLRVLETRSCALCHTVRGTQANGTVGPDLTHLATRARIAAGTLPNASEHLARWIVDPQGVKPGNQMPPTELTPADLDALVRYLGGLA
jgi:cytochrome c oxidase subunit 2